MTSRYDEPAFPCTIPWTVKWPDGGLSTSTEEFGGLTKREFFIGLALQGLLASNGHDSSPASIATRAIRQADFLLAKLSVKTGAENEDKSSEIKP